MTSLRESAKAYQPSKTKNVADLEAVSLDSQFEERTGTGTDGKPFAFSVVVIVGQDYRVPDSVLKDIKAIMEAKPSLKTIKVIKKGTGMQTQYTVIPLE